MEMQRPDNTLLIKLGRQERNAVRNNYGMFYGPIRTGLAVFSEWHTKHHSLWIIRKALDKLFFLIAL